jgi:LPXTG-motif cell wall-anchored protein
MRKFIGGIAAVVVGSGLVLAGAGAAIATGQEKVVICHATGSETNPWESIEVATPALVAHDGHGDLIPAPVDGCPIPVVPVEPPAEEPAEEEETPTEVEEPVAEEPVVEVPGVDELPVEESPTVEEPPYTAPVMNCGEGTVPGWLNGHGDPTSCVGDNPCPEVDFGETCPVDVVEPVVVVPDAPADAVKPVVVAPSSPVVPVVQAKELAYTGSDDTAGFIVAGLLFAVGLGMILVRKFLPRKVGA